MTNPADSSPQRFADMPHVHEHTVVALERAGLTTAFPIQTAVVPVAATGRDVLVKSPTGSGKTLAFGLPIIAQIERGTRTPSAVILVPGRELAIQVRDELVPIAWSLQLRCVAVYGGGSGSKQGKAAAGAPIIVATPGRLVDLVRSKQVDLSHAPILVLDEGVRMLDMGFTPQVEEIAKAMYRRTQTMLFSATLEGRVGKVAADLTTDPVRVERDEIPGAGGEIEHQLVLTSAAAKSDALVDVLDDPKRDLAVVFVRTQKGADNLCETLRTHGLRATTIHGGMSQPERLHEYRVFSRGECDVLVATDVFARGMDLDRITHVINYELPEDADAYRHRTGRTGRAGRTGTAITLVTNSTRSIVEGLVLDLGLPLDLMRTMRAGTTERAKVVAPEARYTDPKERAELQRGDRGGARTRPGRPAAQAGGGAERPAFESAGNGRGKPLTRTHAPRGAAATGAGRGTITSYDPAKGFGFIKQAAGGKDVFFHRKSVSGVDDRTLRPGMPVAFGLDAGTGTKLKAKRVTVEARRV
ncbi:MAG: box helicase domain protein [Thermoleophilia bacterium]|nr:box helicase domain protein [Thermoleophilia bacterium]